MRPRRLPPPPARALRRLAKTPDARALRCPVRVGNIRQDRPERLRRAAARREEVPVRPQHVRDARGRLVDELDAEARDPGVQPVRERLGAGLRGGVEYLCGDNVGRLVVRGRVAAPPRVPRGYSAGRASTWIVRLGL